MMCASPTTSCHGSTTYLEHHWYVLLIWIRRTPTLHPSASSISNKTHLDLYHAPCVPKRCRHLMVMNICVALHVPRSQTMQLLVTCSHLCSNNPSIIITGLPFSGRCSAFWHARSAETQEHDNRVHYFCTTYQSTHTQTSYSHIPRPCAFVACTTKFCANFLLQATNAQVLVMRLGLLTPLCFTSNTHIITVSYKRKHRVAYHLCGQRMCRGAVADPDVGVAADLLVRCLRTPGRVSTVWPSWVLFILSQGLLSSSLAVSPLGTPASTTS